MISRELLRRVIGTGYEITILNFNRGTVSYMIEDEDLKTYHLNLHELTAKCKEWVSKQGFMMTVYHHLDTVAVTLSDGNAHLYSQASMVVYTEPEAVFKACQWVLEEAARDD